MPKEEQEVNLINVTFMPGNIRVKAEQGTNLLKIALDAGVNIAASCGGEGTCGTCRVKIENGETKSAKTNRVTPEEYTEGIRQACITKVFSDAIVTVLPESTIETGVKSKTSAVDNSDSTLSSVISSGGSPLHKLFIELKPPTLSDNVSDLERLKFALKKEYSIENISFDLSVVKNLAETLREGKWSVTLTIIDLPALRSVVRIEAGDTCACLYAIALDIGTTAVDIQLIDLCKGKSISEAIAYNEQIKYGADVITRIAYSQKTGGLDKLQKAVCGTINNLISELFKTSGIDSGEVSCIFISANTIMTHLLFGLNPKYLRLEPYVPTVSNYPIVKTSELGIKLNEHSYIFAVPSVASYIGGDIVAGVVGSGMHQSEKLTLYIDIGTNGEIAIGNNEWLAGASCSAGPAFEGGGIKHGIIACNGAIDGIKINPSNFEPVLSTIGGEKPKGICGAGLIEVISEMLGTGVIDQKGKINRRANSSRIRKGETGFEYVLCDTKQAQSSKEIIITEADIDNLIRAKAAIYAGCQTLAQNVGTDLSEVERIIIAGTFGNKINIEKAIYIGLLPDISRDRFSFIGNGSLLGVRMSALSTDIISQEIFVARHITNIELSDNNDFMNNFIAALFLPHTDIKYFPSIKDKLSGIK